MLVGCRVQGHFLRLDAEPHARSGRHTQFGGGIDGDACGKARRATRLIMPAHQDRGSAGIHLRHRQPDDIARASVRRFRYTATAVGGNTAIASCPVGKSWTGVPYQWAPDWVRSEPSDQWSH